MSKSFLATLSRRLICRSTLSGVKFYQFHHLSLAHSFCSNHPPLSANEESDPDDLHIFSDTGHESSISFDSSADPSSPDSSKEQRSFYDRPLEDGVDIGIYKAILVGKVGQNPLQKELKSGRKVILFSLGTGGIRNNRRPLDNEDPREYANRCAVQWHRVSVYPERLGRIAMKNVVPGSILYVEGNLETKIFSDPMTGLVRRIREIAIRRHGRLVFLGKGETQQHLPNEFKGIGYY